MKISAENILKFGMAVSLQPRKSNAVTRNQALTDIRKGSDPEAELLESQADPTLRPMILSKTHRQQDLPMYERERDRLVASEHQAAQGPTRGQRVKQTVKTVLARFYQDFLEGPKDRKRRLANGNGNGHAVLKPAEPSKSIAEQLAELDWDF